MAWFVEKCCGDVADTLSEAENTDDTDELSQAASVSGNVCPAEQSATATDSGVDTLTGIENFMLCRPYTQTNQW